MKISETMVFVSSLELAERFYTGLGLEVVERQSWGWLLFRDQVSGQKVGALLRSSWTTEPEGWPVPRIAFESENLEADLARLELDGHQVGPIMGSSSATRCSWFKDLDGNVSFIWQAKS